MALWLEHLTGTMEVMGLIPTWNSEIFSVVPSPFTKQPSFTFFKLIASLQTCISMASLHHQIMEHAENISKLLDC